MASLAPNAPIDYKMLVQDDRIHASLYTDPRIFDDRAVRSGGANRRSRLAKGLTAPRTPRPMAPHRFDRAECAGEARARPAGNATVGAVARTVPSRGAARRR